MTSTDLQPADRRVTVRTIRRLDDEWHRLRRRPDLVRRARRWVDLADADDRAQVERLVHRVEDLDDLCAASDRRRCSARRSSRRVHQSGPSPERILRWLVRAARTDPVAARIVLQRVLPGVIHGCRPRLHHGLDERLEDAISTAWITIRTFDERRRGPVAPAIISDATRMARHGPRQRTIVEVPRSALLFDLEVESPAENDPVVDLARTIRSAGHAGVAPVHLELMRELARSVDPHEIARRRGVSTRTIRTRRSDAVRSVRRALGDDWCPVVDAVA